MSDVFSSVLIRVPAIGATLFVCGAAWAGPPFVTDGAEPAEAGRWEIYAPLIKGEGRGPDFEGAAGVEINYGVTSDFQLTIALPVAFAHDRTGWQRGAGDIEMSAKYRFYHDTQARFSIAAAPIFTLPTASNGMGNSRVTGFLPIWLQKDSGDWSVFGGGGYAINPRAGNRDYWSGGVAVTRQATPRLTVGLEADRQGADSIGGRASTRLGLGAIYQLHGPFSLLASGGPAFTDGSGGAGFHAFLALGMDF